MLNLLPISMISHHEMFYCEALNMKETARQLFFTSAVY